MKIYDYNGRKNLSGARIRRARRAAGLTQTELSARLQVEGVLIDRNSLSRLEIGDRFVADYELLAIARALGVGVGFLLGLEEEDGRAHKGKNRGK